MTKSLGFTIGRIDALFSGQGGKRSPEEHSSRIRPQSAALVAETPTANARAMDKPRLESEAKANGSAPVALVPRNSDHPRTGK